MGKEITPRGFSVEDLSSGIVKTIEVGGEVRQDKLKSEGVINPKIDFDNMSEEEVEVFIYGVRPKPNRYDNE